MNDADESEPESDHEHCVVEYYPGGKFAIGAKLCPTAECSETGPKMPWGSLWNRKSRWPKSK